MIAFPGVTAEPAYLDADQVAEDLGPDGAIAHAMQQYEDRPAQRDMARTIANLYNDTGVALIEAGTGVGKSLGYLLPALRWAHLHNERTVVSTNTINLQEQLVRKDLPFLREALADEQKVSFALLKGWRNYLCILRLEQAKLIGPTLLADQSNGIAAISDWASRTEDGSLSDLAYPPTSEVWDEVAAEPDLCIRNECPHFDKCFFFKARRSAAAAHVVVVNHHLLMSDVAVRRMAGNWDDAAVIPAWDRIIIDEGHHLEDAAAAHLGATATRRSLQRLMSRLLRTAARSRNTGTGLLAALEANLRDRRGDVFGSASLILLQEKVFPAVEAVREKGMLVFDLLDAVLRESGQMTLRLTDDFATHRVWHSGLDAALTDFIRESAVLTDTIGLIRERLEQEKEPDEATAALVAELRGAGRRIEALAGAVYGAIDPGPEAHKRIRWLESRGREGNIGVTWVPLDLAPILRDDLFARVKTAVVTSATLSADSRFEFVSSRLGVDQLKIPPITESYPSPFDFKTQAILAVPTDTPPPNSDPVGHFKAVVRMMVEFTDASDGGIFVLFTSHRDVQQAAAELRARGIADERPLLVHGEESRDSLLTRFRESGRAVLLGTSSYWEGVDVAGHALRGLLIAKLPFRVPTEPLTAAHCEAIAERGGDPFAEYMVPHAALRLKQGFGRLIRSSTDRGAIIIADPRVVTKKYGETLMRALPPARRILVNWNDVSRQLRDFYSVTDRTAWQR